MPHPISSTGSSHLLGVTLRVRDLAASVDFYASLLGLAPLDRPGLGPTSDAVWLGGPDGPIVALVASPGPRGVEWPSEWGRLVLAVTDAASLAARLAQADYWVGAPERVDHLGEARTMVRTYDPDGRVVDLVGRD